MIASTRALTPSSPIELQKTLNLSILSPDLSKRQPHKVISIAQYEMRRAFNFERERYLRLIYQDEGNTARQSRIVSMETSLMRFF